MPSSSLLKAALCTLVAFCAWTADLAAQARPATPLPRFYRFPDGQYVLADTFRFQVPGENRTIVIPAGFVTDFASIPEVANLVVKSATWHDLPSLVHDYLYWSQGSKPDADGVFYVALQHTPLKPSLAGAMASAVYRHGTHAWENNCTQRRQGLPRIIPPEYMAALPSATTWREYRKWLRDQGVKATLAGESPPARCIQP